MSTIIHTGDCMDVMAGLPSNSFDAVVADPPYGTGAWLRAESGSGRDCSAVHRREAWDEWSLEWLDEAWRLAGCVCTFVPNSRAASFLSWVGNKPARMHVWIKSDPRPRFGGQPAFGFEPFWVVGPSQPVGGVDWIIASSPRMNRDHDATGHPHQKPITVATRMAELACPPGGSIFDPFAGSGTVGVAAKRIGLTFVGVELNPEYAEMARRRIDAESGCLFGKAVDE